MVRVRIRVRFGVRFGVRVRVRPFSRSREVRFWTRPVLGLVGLVGLALWLVSGIAINKYRFE